MKIEIYKNELKCMEQMIVIMLLNSNYELEQYRLRRGREYAQLFKQVAEFELG
jgi:hypothetical protein